MGYFYSHHLTNMIYKEYIKNNTEEFLAKLSDIARKLNIEPDWLMIVMYAESRINPSAVNPITGATGLIQFMPSTATWLGTTTSLLKNMSNIQQLDYVLKYYQNLGLTGKIKSVHDLYLGTFFPAALGKPDSWVIQTSTISAEKIAEQNKIIDLNKDRNITVSEFKQYVDLYLKKKTLI